MTPASLAARTARRTLVLASSGATLVARSRSEASVGRCVGGPPGLGPTAQHGTVIDDVDRSLAVWLSRCLPTGVTVRFASPLAGWADRPPDPPLVNGFLYEIREDTSMLVADRVALRDSDGHTTARREPTRRYRLRYLLTAWTADAEDPVPLEHELLAAVLRGAVSHLSIPADCLVGSLAEAAELIPLRCAPSCEKPIGPDLYAHLGLPPKTTLDLVVTAPLVPAARTELAPAPSGVDLNAGQRGAVGGRPVSGGGDRPRGRITERS